MCGDLGSCIVVSSVALVAIQCHMPQLDPQGLLQLSAYIQNQLLCHQSAVSFGRLSIVPTEILFVWRGVVDLSLDLASWAVGSQEVSMEHTTERWACGSWPRVQACLVSRWR